MSNNLAPAKILYIDDDYLLRILISLILEQHGFQVRVAYNGAEGVKIALEWLPDLILMDLMMPIMDGFQVTQILRADPRTQHTPILAFSATSEATMEAEIKAVGMNDFVPKLNWSVHLIKIIRAYLP